MAEVVLVHGAFHEMWGPFRLWVRWTPSLLDGLWVSGVPLAEVSLPRLQERSAVAFWGDLVRPEPRDNVPASNPSELPEIMGGVRGGASGSPDHGVTGDGAGADLDALVQQVARDTNARSMDLLAQYVLDPVVRSRVHERLERHLGPETRVVVAHSLGTVIAYQVLCARPDLSLDLITLGSPLGDRNMVFDLLQPAPVDGTGVWPTAVRTWTNVAAEGDLATAGCPRLSDAFGSRVSDHLVFNGRHAHDVEPYLSSAPTGSALADALGLPRR